MDSSEPAKLKILHVDDFDEFLDEFRDLFRDHFEIASVPSGAEGLKALEEERFDAVIVDFDMPDMDGLAFMATAKERWPFLPVIFCTGQGNEEVARAAFTAGAANYFRKDFSTFVDRQKLVNTVREAIDRRVGALALEKERRRLESIIELNPYAIMLHDREGRPQHWNRAALKMWNMDPDKAYFKEYCAWDDPILLEKGYGPLWERIWSGEPVSFPLVSYNPSSLGTDPELPDRLRYVAAVAFPLMDEQAGFEGMVVMQEDVTARVEAEESLRKAHVALQESHEQLEARVQQRTAELAAANEALQREIDLRDRLRAELVRKNRELEEFSSRVGHDLRNELLVLKRTLELASEDPEVRRRSQGILERYDHLIDFVQHLLNLARAGSVISRRVEIPAEPMLRGIFERLRPPDTEAEVHIPAGCPPIPGDPVGIDQVLSNLFSNSFQHVDPVKGRVRIEVEVNAGDESTEVVYRDDGVGIAVENLERVFDMSFTTDRPRRFGLGLSLAKKIVEAHGGRIGVDSGGRGKGVEFVVVLPRCASKARRPAPVR